MAHVWTVLKFALWLLIFLRVPMMLDKKVYFLCLDYIMFVCGIIHILRLHILFKNLLDFSRLRKVQ